MSARHTEPDDRLFPGESEMARLMRAFDWSRTPLGPVVSWSPALRTMVRVLLVPFPMLLWWGARYIQLYNETATCRRIRALPRGKEICLVALTGWGNDRDKQPAEDAGFNLHLMKPADPTALKRFLASPE